MKLFNYGLNTCRRKSRKRMKTFKGVTLGGKKARKKKKEIPGRKSNMTKLKVP